LNCIAPTTDTRSPPDTRACARCPLVCPWGAPQRFPWGSPEGPPAECPQVPQGIPWVTIWGGLTGGPGEIRSPGGGFSPERSLVPEHNVVLGVTPSDLLALPSVHPHPPSPNTLPRTCESYLPTHHRHPRLMVPGRPPGDSLEDHPGAPLGDPQGVLGESPGESARGLGSLDPLMAPLGDLPEDPPGDPAGGVGDSLRDPPEYPWTSPGGRPGGSLERAPADPWGTPWGVHWGSPCPPPKDPRVPGGGSCPRLPWASTT
jgi:hypothetical protein